MNTDLLPKSPHGDNQNSIMSEHAPAKSSSSTKRGATSWPNSPVKRNASVFTPLKSMGIAKMPLPYSPPRLTGDVDSDTDTAGDVPQADTYIGPLPVAPAVSGWSNNPASLALLGPGSFLRAHIRPDSPMPPSDGTLSVPPSSLSRARSSTGLGGLQLSTPRTLRHRSAVTSLSDFSSTDSVDRLSTLPAIYPLDMSGERAIGRRNRTRSNQDHKLPPLCSLSTSSMQDVFNTPKTMSAASISRYHSHANLSLSTTSVSGQNPLSSRQARLSDGA